MRVVGDIEGKQHQAARVQHIVEPQRFRTIAQTAAHGYAIQERGGALVRAIHGDYLNVVGLPVQALLDLVPSLLGH